MGFENGRLVRVTLRATATDGEEQVQTFHYDLVDSLVGANSPQDLADRFRDDVIPNWKSLYSSAWSIQPVVVTEEKDPLHPLDPRSQWTSGTVVAGTKVISGSDLLPPHCAILVAWNTDLIGRRFRGRSWYGGSLLEGEQAAGSWTSGWITAMETVIDDIPLEPDIATGDPVGVSANLCVYSRTQRAASLDPYAAHITGHTTRTLVHTLRRRALYS
jgi:hypothetical protein